MYKFIEAMYKTRATVAFSGGLDSTYVLWNLSQNSMKSIHAHHVILKNKSEKRWKEEEIACQNIIQYFEKINIHIDYTTSVWDTSEFDMLFRDYIVYLLHMAFVASHIAKHYRERIHISTGVLSNERAANRYAVDPVKIYWNMCYNMIQEQYKKYISPVLLYPLEAITKKEIVDELPHDVFRLTMSCRKPVNGNPCGGCPQCITERQQGIFELRQ